MLYFTVDTQFVGSFSLLLGKPLSNFEQFDIDMERIL